MVGDGARKAGGRGKMTNNKHDGERGEKSQMGSVIRGSMEQDNERNLC